MGGRRGRRGETASTTLRDLRVAEVVKQDVQINEGGAVTYRIKLQVWFKYEAVGDSSPMTRLVADPAG